MMTYIDIRREDMQCQTRNHKDNFNVHFGQEFLEEIKEKWKSDNF